MTDSKKEANRKWDAQNMASITCRVKADKAAKFKQICEDKGTTANAVLKQAIENYIEQNESCVIREEKS